MTAACSCAAYVARSAGRTSLSLGADRRRVRNEQRPDVASERFASDSVGERGQGVRADSRPLDERADHRLTRERRATEHASVHHRRVNGVGADQRPPLVGR